MSTAFAVRVICFNLDFCRVCDIKRKHSLSMTGIVIQFNVSIADVFLTSEHIDMCSFYNISDLMCNVFF